MTRPRESDYTSHVAYTRALEAYCDQLERKKHIIGNKVWFENGVLMTEELDAKELYKVYDITGAEPPPPDSGFARLESL